MCQTAALAAVLEEFMAIAAIPRPSHHEERIAAHLLDWAAAHGLHARQDAAGNVCVEKPATPGCEQAPRVILQAHMDMVCVAAKGVSFDPLTDPIRVKNDGVTLTAEGTSLGADDGIGIALALYVLSRDPLPHGPLRAVFTVNEEDGMSSGDMDPAFLQAEYLINLDWEALGSLCNSCAGSDFLTFTRSFTRCAPAEGSLPVQISLDGLCGGHSGADIHLGRLNALVSLARFLRTLADTVPFQLVSFHGGQARNAIPSEATAEIRIPREQLPAVEAAAADCARTLLAEAGSIEKTLSLHCSPCENTGTGLQDTCIPGEDADALTALLLALPNGVHTMSPHVPGLVESSQNLGILRTDTTRFQLLAMERSCEAGRAEEILELDRQAAEQYGFLHATSDHAPPWAVNPNSRLTPLACSVYRALTGEDMAVEPVHAGLECGDFLDISPDLDMISIGPSLENVHSPKESCDLHSVQVTADLVVRILEQLSR